MYMLASCTYVCVMGMSKLIVIICMAAGPDGAVQALEEAIGSRLARVEAGAQGEHKLQRGYLPALTYSR